MSATNADFLVEIRSGSSSSGLGRLGVGRTRNGSQKGNLRFASKKMRRRPRRRMRMILFLNRQQSQKFTQLNPFCSKVFFFNFCFDPRFSIFEFKSLKAGVLKLFWLSTPIFVFRNLATLKDVKYHTKEPLFGNYLVKLTKKFSVS